MQATFNASFLKALGLFVFLMLCLPASDAVIVAQQDRQLVQTPDAKVTNKRVALVIGNGAYTNAPPLKNPPNDAALVAGTLEKLGFDVIVGTNRSQREMKQLIRQFGQSLRSGGAVGLFYYAGHGVQSKGHNYLVPIDADIQNEADLEDVSIDVNYVLATMDDAQNALNIVILDACRNNPFGRGFRSAQGGLAQIKAPTGTLIAYATSPDSTAADGDMGNSPYTEELVKQMESHGVVLETMFRRVTEQVSARTAGRQEPWFSDNHKGDFYFSSARAGSNASDNPQPGEMTERRPSPVPPLDVSAGGVLNKKAISLPEPVYPAIAKAAGMEGVVTVEVTVNEEGEVISARATSGLVILQSAAVAAANQARFSRTIVNGKPVKVIGIINYNFALPKDR